MSDSIKKYNELVEDGIIKEDKVITSEVKGTT